MIPKIQVFSRHCIFSDISAHKKRPLDFSREKCYRNLLETIDFERAELIFFLDTFKGNEHFVKSGPHRVIECKEGSEAASFLALLNYIESLSLHPDTIVYIVEDDYLHRPGWTEILAEGFDLNADYVTLYDHRDKYLLPMYRTLTSKILLSPSSHWRTTPSTTNTFAARWRTLQKHSAIHRRFSEKRKISADHEKFCYLGKKGASLISPIPGWSTHVCEREVISPFWETLNI